MKSYREARREAAKTAPFRVKRGKVIEYVFGSNDDAVRMAEDWSRDAAENPRCHRSLTTAAKRDGRKWEVFCGIETVGNEVIR